MGWESWQAPQGWIDAVGRAKAQYENTASRQIVEPQVVKAHIRKLKNIIIRRIPKKGLVAGHYWIEIIHHDEDEMDDFMKQARKNKLTEENITTLPIKACSKANGFRESYGWYPDNGAFHVENTFNSKRWISAKGYLNGDCEIRKEKDKKLDLTYQRDREAGRKRQNNELSSRPFDPHQNGRLHPEKIDFTTHPYILSDDSRTELAIFNDIRKFAKDFKDEWSWNGDGYDETNCHTFLFLLLAHCQLADPDCIGKRYDKHFEDYKKSLDRKKQIKDEKFAKRKILIQKLSDMSNLTKSG